MNRRDIVIGGVILVILAISILALRNNSSPRPTITLPSPTPSVEQSIESKFKIDLPENIEKANLTDLTDKGNIGIATRSWEKNVFTLSVLADLAEAEQGSFYQAWLSKTKAGENGEVVSLGRMKVAKGGWLIDYQTGRDLREFEYVIVSQEAKLGIRPVKVIMEGGF